METLSFKYNKNEFTPSSDKLVAVVNANGELDFKDREYALDPENEQKRLIVAVMSTIIDENGKRYVLVQRRDKNKKELPNHLTFSASGHVNPRDIKEDGTLDLQESMRREMEEETGLILEDKISRITNFESIEKKEDSKDVKKLVALGIYSIEPDELLKLTTNEEVSGFEILPLDFLQQEFQLEQENRSSKYSPNFIQAVNIAVEQNLFENSFPEP